MLKRNLLILSTLTLALGLAGCVEDNGDDGNVEVIQMVSGNEFDPDNITITAGTTVRWHNVDSMEHTATSNPVDVPDAQAWDSGMLSAGETFDHTFDEPGEYPYYCIPHGGVDSESGECTGMCAMIIVEAAE